MCSHKKPTNLERSCGDDHIENGTAWGKFFLKRKKNCSTTKRKKRDALQKQN